MTGPLAQQFAQVREWIERTATETCNEGGCPECQPQHDALAALSVIERHVQDMEKALGLIASTNGVGVPLRLVDARAVARRAFDSGGVLRGRDRSPAAPPDAALSAREEGAE